MSHNNFDNVDDEKRQKENPEQNDLYLEETAAEVIPIQEQGEYRRDRPLEEDKIENRQIDTKSSIGIFALVLSILSLLFMPIVLGAAGIIAGVFARQRDAKTMGNWAIALGAISIVVSLFLSPFI